MNKPIEPRTSPPALWLMSLSSLLIASIVLVCFVLPAEYDLDPTGLGELMGIKGMSGYVVSALSIENQTYRCDQVSFELAPFESVEYKYTLAANQAMVYDWHAGAEVVFDFHSEQTGSDPEDAVSFSIGRADRQSGTYVAPFDGIHGWFWENRGEQTAIVVLSAAGYFSQATTYNRSGAYPRDLGDAAAC